MNGKRRLVMVVLLFALEVFEFTSAYATTIDNKRELGNQLPIGIDQSLLPDADSNGAQLVKQYCTQCHDLPSPSLHSAEEWPSVVERMHKTMRMVQNQGRMGMMKSRVEIPSKKELHILLSYLQKYAQKPINATQYRDLLTSAGQAFTVVCSQCHILPDPTQHPAKDWPAVVERMKQYMTEMEKPVPDQATLNEIIKFLQEHAGS